MGGRGGKGRSRVDQHAPAHPQPMDDDLYRPPATPPESEREHPPTEQAPDAADMRESKPKLGPTPTEGERAKLDAFVTEMQARAATSPDDRYTAGAKRDAETRAEIRAAQVRGALDAAEEQVPKLGGDYMRLSDLRAALPKDMSRAEVDAVLKQMSRNGEITLVPNPNRKDLTQADHDNAITIGGDHNHLLYRNDPEEDTW